MALTKAHFEEHVTSREVHPPKILYKYASLETARKVLSSGKVLFQSPLNYNDPFDSQWDVFWTMYTPEAKEYASKLVQSAVRDPSSWPNDADPKHLSALRETLRRMESLTPVEREMGINSLVLALSSELVVPDNIVLRMLDIKRRLRVLCLCEDEKSILMWSHYGDQHRGVVLGFDTQLLEKGLNRPLEPIKYIDELPTIIEYKSFIRELFYGASKTTVEWHKREWALTKHSGWSYEMEWRFVTIADSGTLGDSSLLAFPREALVEVVLGCRTDSVRSLELAALSRGVNNSCKQYRISQERGRFELIKELVDIKTLHDLGRDRR